jgi:adenylosuccinate synthase
MITKKQYEMLEDMTTGQLTDLWNETTDSKLKKFKTKGQGVSRLQSLYEDHRRTDDTSEEESTDSDILDTPVAPAKKSKVSKRKLTDEQRFAGQVRMTAMIKMLRKDDYTAEELAEEFGVKYKSICNDLFNIRHRRHSEIKDDEELIRVKNESGRKRLYGIVLREDK